MRLRHSSLPYPESGIAIIAVMWIVAGLTLLVAGMITSSRANVAAAQMIQGDVEAAALGDAAIERAVLNVFAEAEAVTKLATREYAVGGRSVSVRIQPANGFVNVNVASESLLRDLFVFGAGMTQEAGETLAQRVIDWRDADDSAMPLGAEEDAYVAAGTLFRPRGERFDVPEDLLQVLGFSFDTYARIEPMITVIGDAALVDPLAAGIDVLTVLGHGDAELARKLAGARDAGGLLVDTSGLEQAHLASGAAQIFRFEAIVVDEGRVRTRARWIDTGCRRGTLPWCTLSVEPVSSQRIGVTRDGA